MCSDNVPRLRLVAFLYFTAVQESKDLKFVALDFLIQIQNYENHDRYNH